MVILVRKLDEISFMAKVKDKLLVVWEFEGEFVLWLHIKENRLLLDIEQRKVECDL